MVTRRSSQGISRISALVQVVLPEPVAPDTTMFLRERTARRMNAGYCCSACRRSSSSSASSHSALARRVLLNTPRRVSSSIDHTTSAGRRMVMATHPMVVAGGRTICTRSPEGSEADRSGADSSTRWRVILAMSLASRRHQSKSANGTSSRRQPARVSMKISRGRLMHSSVTSGSASRGRNARRVRSSAESSLPAAGAGAPEAGAREKPSTASGGGAQFIHRPEINIARDQHLDAIAVALDDSRGYVEGVLEYLGEDLLGSRGRIDDRAAAGAVGRLYSRLHRTIDERHQH